MSKSISRSMLNNQNRKQETITVLLAAFEPSNMLEHVIQTEKQQWQHDCTETLHASHELHASMSSTSNSATDGSQNIQEILLFSQQHVCLTSLDFLIHGRRPEAHSQQGGG